MTGLVLRAFAQAGFDEANDPSVQRGAQRLVRDPNRGGPAVVLIEDYKRGREGYTFDIMWRGGEDDYRRRR